MTFGFTNSTFNATSVICDDITINNAPVNPTDGTNKAYVDLIAAGFSFKSACFASSTANLNAIYNNGAAGVGATLTNNGALAAFSTDGISPALNARVLIEDQTAELENGIYTLTTVGSGAVAWVLTRAIDYDTPAEIQQGDIVAVEFGTLNANTLWMQTDAVAAVGVDAIKFVEFNSQGIIVTQFSALVGGAGNTITSVAPSATAGVAFVSSGVGVDPAFNTVVVAGGGTGATTFTANGILLGNGTTAVTASAALTNGQLLIGSTGVAPVPASITGGTGITITPGAGSITISSTGGFTWTDVVGVAQAMAINNGYVANNAALVTMTLPAVAAFGSVVQVAGLGAGGWRVAQNAGQTIHFEGLDSTLGVAGSVSSTNRYDSVELLCVVANTDWTVIDVVGNLTVV